MACARNRSMLLSDSARVMRSTKHRTSGLAPALLVVVTSVAGCTAGADDTVPAGKASSSGMPDAGIDADAGPPVDLELAQYVDPFIGTDDSSSSHPVPGGAGGSTYPGAVAPFGMVQFSP